MSSLLLSFTAARNIAIAAGTWQQEHIMHRMHYAADEQRWLLAAVFPAKEAIHA